MAGLGPSLCEEMLSMGEPVDFWEDPRSEEQAAPADSLDDRT